MHAPDAGVQLAITSSTTSTFSILPGFVVLPLVILTRPHLIIIQFLLAGRPDLLSCEFFDMDRRSFTR